MDPTVVVECLGVEDEILKEAFPGSRRTATDYYLGVHEEKVLTFASLSVLSLERISKHSIRSTFGGKVRTPTQTSIEPQLVVSEIYPIPYLLTFIEGKRCTRSFFLVLFYLVTLRILRKLCFRIGSPWQPRFGFFGLSDWPGLEKALAKRPVVGADVEMWGRENTLWQGGQLLGFCSADWKISYWGEGHPTYDVYMYSRVVVFSKGFGVFIGGHWYFEPWPYVGRRNGFEVRFLFGCFA